MAEVRRDPLTPEESAALRGVRADWLAVGLSTETADRAEAEAAVKDLYAVMGWKEPMTVWMESPLGGCYAAAWFEEVTKGAGKKDQFWDQLRGQLWDQLGGQLRGQLGGQLRDQLRGQLRGQLGDQLGDQLGGQLGGQLGDQLRDQISNSWWGQHDAFWIAWLRFAREVGATYDKHLDKGLEAWSRITRSCGWWWPREGVVVLTERPNVLTRDPDGRLHCDDGPSVSYPDGWSVWAWHGIRVAQEVIEDPTFLTIDRITKQPNAELRRCYMEIYGQGRYMAEAGGELLDEVHEPPFPGLIDAKLWRLPNPEGGEAFVCLECRNSTPEPDGHHKIYNLWVDPLLRPLLAPDERGDARFGEPQELTALAAVASTFGMRAEEYEPAVES